MYLLNYFFLLVLFFVAAPYITIIFLLTQIISKKYKHYK